METKERELRVYRGRDGKRPFSEWLEGLRDRQTRARVRARLARLQLGNFGDCKGVGGGVQELRIHCGPGYRVYFGLDGDTLVILLIGGDKRSQSSDVKRAQHLWEEHRNANG